MKTIQFSDEQLTYLRQVVMDSITDDAHFLRRINRGQSPQWYKDNTARVETGSDIMAKLKGPEERTLAVSRPGQSVVDFIAEQNALGKIPAITPASPVRDDYIDECLDVLGITREAYNKAVAKRCVHGSLATQPCAECDNLSPVGDTCAHGTPITMSCSECLGVTGKVLVD